MAWTDDEMVTAFDAEASVAATLATAAQKIQWWNEGQARLPFYKPSVDDITWAAAAREVALEANFISLDKIVTGDGFTPQPWRVFGKNLVLDAPTGATEAGGARVYYWGEWTPMSTSTTATELTTAQDFACMYYALSRFFNRLASSRAYYKRYATLVGQNGVSMADLQSEADGYYQDYLDARADHRPNPPAFAYEG